MSTLYVLDTDHLSLLQRGHPHVIARLAAIPVVQRAVTIISADEQLQGRLAVIRRAKTQTDAARTYERLREAIQFFADDNRWPIEWPGVTLLERGAVGL